jgi:predicted DNA-binding protein (UPF0251 family)
MSPIRRPRRPPLGHRRLPQLSPPRPLRRQRESFNETLKAKLATLELRVLCLLYRDFRQSEVARQLGIEKREVEKAVRAIRAKMADWRASAGDDIPAAQRETRIAA